MCCLSCKCTPSVWPGDHGHDFRDCSGRSGGCRAGATVNVRNLDTNLKRSQVTESDGRFRFLGLAIGPYELTVEHTGFARYVRGPIMLLLNQDAVVNPALEVAAATEKVTVTEDAPMLNTTSPEGGVRFDERRLTDLPTLPSPATGAGGFRDAFAFALAAPGVSQLNSGNQVFASGTNFSVNGSRLRSNNFMIDGQDSNDPTATGRQQVLNNPEIVQEFRLITNQFSAEYGQAAGSVVNLVTKSGTNDFHGSAFWFHNDNALNSCSNLDKRAGLTDPRFCSSLSVGREGAPFRIENQFGDTLGGPIRRNRSVGPTASWVRARPSAACPLMPERRCFSPASDRALRLPLFCSLYLAPQRRARIPVGTRRLPPIASAAERCPLAQGAPGLTFLRGLSPLPRPLSSTTGRPRVAWTTPSTHNIPWAVATYSATASREA